MEMIKSQFLGFDSSYEDSDIVFFGIPFDGTCSFRPGSRFAPFYVREASFGLEIYSPYQDKELMEYKIADLGDMELPFGNTEKALKNMEDFSRELLDNGKKIFAFGGEHLVTLPIVKAYHKKYPDLEIIHFDAHTDLRDNYLGEKLSHASVIRLIHEFINGEKIHQFGIRSGEKYEFEYGRKYMDFNPFNLDNFQSSIDKIADDTPIYITLDIDVLDPSIMHGTGTPEPGGVTFNELLNALLKLKGKNIVGMDLVELAPNYDNSGVSNIVAAKLVREMAMLF